MWEKITSGFQTSIILSIRSADHNNFGLEAGHNYRTFSRFFVYLISIPSSLNIFSILRVKRGYKFYSVSKVVVPNMTNCVYVSGKISSVLKKKQKPCSSHMISFGNHHNQMIIITLDIAALLFTAVIPFTLTYSSVMQLPKSRRYNGKSL